MDSVFTHQEEREDNQQPQEQQQQLLLQEEEDHQQKLCVPFLKPGSFDNSNPFSHFRFWVSKSFKNFNCKGGFSSRFGLKRLECNVVVVNNTVYCSSPREATMERLNIIEENEIHEEIKHQVFIENERRIETFDKMVEEKGRESSSSLCFLTSETTEHEENIHSSSEESSSPTTLDWPVQKAEAPDCNSVDGIENEKKPVTEDRKMEKPGSDISEIEMMKERFAKLLLGEDMSGSGSGVCSALAISNAITNLCATVFGQLWRLEPWPVEKKAMWKREMEWLLSVSDHIVELMPSWQTFPDGSKLEVMTSRPRSDLYVNLPALRKLDNMLLEILDSFENTEFWYIDQGILPPEADGSASFRRAFQRQEEKWWLPVPRVPPGGLHEITRKQLQQKRDCTNQILKAAMAINSITLADMEVPESYLESLPKNVRASLGDVIYRHISSDEFSPECLLECLDLSSEHQAIEIANRVEASIYVWRRRTNSKPVNNAARPTSKSSWELVKELVVDTDKRELLADRAESLLLCLKQGVPGLPQTALDMSKIQYNKDVGKSILESYSRVLESLAFNIITRIDDLLYVDDVTKHSDPHSRVSKVGVIAQKSISIPYPGHFASTPCRYRTAYTTQCISPAPLLSPAKGEGSPFRASGKVPQRGVGVKKALTDYLTIDTTGNSIDEANSILNGIPQATPPQLD